MAETPLHCSSIGEREKENLKGVLENLKGVLENLKGVLENLKDKGV